MPGSEISIESGCRFVRSSPTSLFLGTAPERLLHTVSGRWRESSDRQESTQPPVEFTTDDRRLPEVERTVPKGFRVAGPRPERPLAHIANCVRCVLVTGHRPEIVPNGCFLISCPAALDTEETVKSSEAQSRVEKYSSHSTRLPTGKSSAKGDEGLSIRSGRSTQPAPNTGLPGQRERLR